MSSIEKILIFVASVMALYFYWLSPYVFLIAEWPTPKLMLLTFGPVMLFVFPSLLMRYIPVDPKIRNLFVFISIAGSVYLLFVIKTYEVFGPERRQVRNVEGKPTCSARVFDVKPGNNVRNGVCSFQFFVPNQGKVGKLTIRNTAAGCIESINKTCSDFCGNRVLPGDNHINHYILNFGPKENFDEIHLPFQATQTVALVSCEDDYFYRQKLPPSFTDTLKNYGGVSP